MNDQAKAIFEVLFTPQERAALTMLSALKFLNKEFACASSGGAKSKPTMAQLNAIWERARAAIQAADEAGIRTE
jgi:hypothetical protein